MIKFRNFTLEQTDLDEAMSPEHKKVAQEVHKQLKRDEPMAAAAGLKFKATHSMLRSKYGDDWRKKAGIKEEADLDENQLTAQQVKQGIGIAKDKRYAGGNMSGAVKAMSKLHKNLAKHPAVKKELQKQNEETDLDEGKATISAAMKRSEDAHKVAINKAKRWMKKSGRSAEDAVKEFDLFKDDVKHLKEETDLDEAIKLKTKVKIHAPGKDYHEKVGTVGEIRDGLHKGAEKTYTVDYDYNTNTGRSQSIQLNKKNIKLYKEETDLEEASYEIYHRDFSSAVQHAKKQAEKRGYTIDDDEWFRKVASGPRKPSSGKTNSYNIELLDKNGKPIKKNLSMQVYNMDNKKYELNMYTEETDLDEKLEMAENQLYFVVYAAEEILEYIDMGGEVEEWYQNKLSKVHSDMESLHSYVEGEMRRTGMKEETELDESKTLSPGWMLKADPKLGAAVKAAKDLYKKRIAAYGNPAAGVSIKDRTKDGKNVKKEETDINEISSNLASRYHSKASATLKKHSDSASLARSQSKKTKDPVLKKELGDMASKAERKLKNRTVGMSRAGVKMEETDFDEASPMIKPPVNSFSDKKSAIEYKNKNGGKVMMSKFTNPRTGETTTTYKVVKEEKQLDPVNKKELKKDFSDRTDKDIDNDGDVDDSDEYLHNRRKAISKNVKEESNLQELKKSTLLSYIKKSSKDARLASTVGDKEVTKKRTKGIEKAAGKLSETKQMSPALKALLDKKSVKQHNTSKFGSHPDKKDPMKDKIYPGSSTDAPKDIAKSSTKSNIKVDGWGRVIRDRNIIRPQDRRV